MPDLSIVFFTFIVFDFVLETYVVSEFVLNMPRAKFVQNHGRDEEIVEHLHHSEMLEGWRKDVTNVVSEAICQGTVLVTEEEAEEVVTVAAEGLQ